MNPDSYCDSFWLASQNVTERLGAAFARSLFYRTAEEIAAKPTIRIGIAAAADVGKSTFVRGFESVFDKPFFLERRKEMSGGVNETSLEPTSWFSSSLAPKEFVQSLKVTKEMGAVLQRDALWNKMYGTSRLSNFDDTHRYGQVNVELIEHPYFDENKDFDCVIFMQKKSDWSLSKLFNNPRGFGRTEREMSIYATQELRNSDRFKALQAELKPFSTNI